MGLLGRLARPAAKARVCCIGLDGTPHSLLLRLLREGVMPNLAAIMGEGRLARMSSVHPWVSSVAWTTLQTGVNPGRHGIFGFIDRDPATLKAFIPLANRIAYPSVWDVLGRAGKRSIVLNVPVTYPVAPINGIMVAGFLAPRLNEKAVYPATLLPELERLGYRVDSEPHLGHEDKAAAMEDLRDTLEKRARTFLHLLQSQPWDLFLGVIMETDRLHHFYYELMEKGDATYAPAFFDLYRRVDGFLGQVGSALSGGDTLILVSDHGSCSIRQEVFYNRWLAERGYLKYAQEPAKGLDQMHPDSVAYSLDPARIFLNVRGRERDGRVQPGADYERLRDEVVEAAQSFSLPGPAGAERTVERAYRREELYSGPLLAQAADIILAPVDGYDPKGAFYPRALTASNGAMVGMHSYSDAFIYLSGRGQAPAKANILDVAPTILAALGVPAPPEYEGQPLLG